MNIQSHIQDWALSWEIAIYYVEKRELIDELNSILINSKVDSHVIRNYLKKSGWYSFEMEEAFTGLKEKFFIYNEKVNKTFEITEITFQNHEILVGKLGIPNIPEEDRIVTIIKKTNEVLHRKLKNYYLK
jgi:hypothetical protein